VQRWGVWAPDFKLQGGEELIHLLNTKGSTPLEMRRTLSKPDDGLLIILSSEESPMLIN
jgi:hypothetical protein